MLHPPAVEVANRLTTFCSETGLAGDDNSPQSLVLDALPYRPNKRLTNRLIPDMADLDADSVLESSVSTRFGIKD